MTRIGTSRAMTALIVAVAASAVAYGLPAGAEPIVGPPRDVGDVAVVDPLNVSRLIDEGGSAVPFALAPPSGSTCPGDSAHDQWRIQSFLIPIGDDVAELQWGDNDPTGRGQWSLYGIDTRPFIHETLAANRGAGEEGLILPVRPLTFAVFLNDILEPGRYRAGLACTYYGRLDRYWDTQFDIEFDAADEPARLHWTVFKPTPSPAAGSGGSRDVLIALGVLGVAAAILVRSRARGAAPVPHATRRPHGEAS